jgi:potassium efflux system protein
VAAVAWLAAASAGEPEGPPSPAEQPPAPQGSPGLPTAAELAARIEAIGSDESLADEVRTAVREQYEKALAALNQRAADREQAAGLEQLAATAEQRQQEAEAALGKPVAADLPAVAADAPVEKIEAARREAEAALATATTAVNSIKTTIAERRKESKTLPQDIASLEGEAAKLEQDLPEDPDVDPALARAQGVARSATAVATVAAVELARQKLATYEAEAGLLPLQQQRLEARVAAITARLEELNRMVAAKRQDVIATRVTEFEQELATAADARRHAASTTIGLVARCRELAPLARQAAGELVSIREQVASLRADLARTEGLVAGDLATGGGLSRSVGYLLERTRASLPRDGQLADRAAAQSRLVDDTQEILARIDARLDELGPPAAGDEPEDVPAIDSVERKILTTLDHDAERLLVETLIPLGVQQTSLRTVTRDYRRLIDRHLLWVRSARRLEAADLGEAAEGLGWLARPGRGRQLLDDLFAAASARPLAVVAGCGVVALLLALHRRFVKQIVRLGGVVAGRGHLLLRPTLAAMVVTVLAAVPVWLGLWLLARLLASISGGDSFGGSFATALDTVAHILLPLEFLRQFLRPHGLAGGHFGWPAPVIAALRLAARRGVAFALPLVFLWKLLELESGSREEVIAAARLAFILLMVVVAWIVWAVTHPTRGVTTALARAWGGAAAARLSWFWRALATGVPLSLAALMFLGYGYSATQLAASWQQSLWMVFAALAIHSLAVRWLLVSRRRLALDQMRQKALERQQAQERQQLDPAGGTATSPPIHDEPALDISTINQQTRRLFDAALFVAVLGGLVWIWSPVLPALEFLDRFSLWQLRAADGTVTGAVTLANLLLAVPLVVLTFIVVRNAPGLLEAAVLRHLPLDNAGRYAITSLASYLLAGVGIIATAATLGLSWGGVQWLVAGLSVGLGFGLQEIVANFICGIILLFEQPIRVGDVVTLDGVTGVVSRIRMRATTVTTWERQEYIVPNKDLITGRVTNWTLTDTTNRVEIRVGVAYGTDTRLACGMLREICQANGDVLAEPAPLITFEEFADSALTITLRLYLGSLDRRLDVINDVHTAIHERFNAAGIEIAFPQLDVHLRTPHAG